MTYAFFAPQDEWACDFRPYTIACAAIPTVLLRRAGVWGAFHGLFGVGSNELIVVTYGDVAGVDNALGAADDVASVDTLLLEPTVRPPKTCRAAARVCTCFGSSRSITRTWTRSPRFLSRRGEISRPAPTIRPFRKGCFGNIT